MYQWVVAAFIIGLFSVVGLEYFGFSQPPQQQIANVNSVENLACEDSKPEPLQLRTDQNAQAFAMIETNGRRVRALVDTGASMTALTAQDAVTLGLKMRDPSRREARFSTANGEVVAQLDQLLNVNVGPLCTYVLEVAIMPEGALKTSLLGMNFMRKMRRVEYGQGMISLFQ